MGANEPVLTVLDAIAFADGAIARLFIERPDEQSVAALASDEMRCAIDLLDDDTGALERLRSAAASAVDATGLEDLATEFDDTFFGVRTKIKPYESVFTSDDGLLFQESTIEVRRAYRALGLEAPGGHRFPDDSFALEFDFMQSACLQAAQRVERGDDPDAARVLDSAVRFIDDHLGKWAAPFAASFTGTKHEGGPYARLSELASGLVGGQRNALAQVRSLLRAE